MERINEYLTQSRLKVKQLENQKRMRKRREEEQKKKIDTRRKILIGELVCKYFPALREYQLKSSKDGDDTGFVEFENILVWLSSNEDFLKKIKTLSGKKL